MAGRAARVLGAGMGRILLAAVAALALICAGVLLLDPPSRGGPSRTSLPDATTSTEPTGWGPTLGEWATAQQIVAGWGPDRLAGGVIVGRYHGTDPEIPAALVTEQHLAGVSVTGQNVLDADQVLATTAAVRAAAAADGREFPPVVGVDQEGGYVSHLRGVATEFPAQSVVGQVVDSQGRAGRRKARAAARDTGLELRGLGFTWVFAPVADVTVGAGDAAIGTRSAGEDPRLVAKVVTAQVRGFRKAGVVSTTKHFPGHGSAGTDSHDGLPVLERSVEELRATDLVPFRRAVARHAPAVMVAHLEVPDLAPGVPTSLAPQTYELLRASGFEGVAITDSLGMGALAGQEQPGVRALVAGADLLLMPVDPVETHRLVRRALKSGDLSTDRVREAAARVVALQLWQQRIESRRPVPSDVADRAARSAERLREP